MREIGGLAAILDHTEVYGRVLSVLFIGLPYLRRVQVLQRTLAEDNFLPANQIISISLKRRASSHCVILCLSSFGGGRLVQVSLWIICSQQQRIALCCKSLLLPTILVFGAIHRSDQVNLLDVHGFRGLEVVGPAQGGAHSERAVVRTNYVLALAGVDERSRATSFEQRHASHFHQGARLRAQWPIPARLALIHSRNQFLARRLLYHICMLILRWSFRLHIRWLCGCSESAVDEALGHVRWRLRPLRVPV